MIWKHTAAILVTSTLAGCAFLIDVPEYKDDASTTTSSTQVGGMGGSGGSGGGGGTGGIGGCPNLGSPIEAKTFVTLTDAGVSGLARSADTTFAFGINATDSLGFPPSGNSTVYMRGYPDSSMGFDNTGWMVACGAFGSGSFGSFGATIHNGKPVGVGFIPTVLSNESMVDLGTNGSACSGNERAVIAGDAYPSALQAFVADFSHADEAVAISSEAHGTLFDVVSRYDGSALYGLGLNYDTSIWGATETGSQSRYHLVTFSASDSAISATNAVQLQQNASAPGFSSDFDSAGAIAVDNAGHAWATGVNCRQADVSSCPTNKTYFVVEWDGAGQPEVRNPQSNTGTSFGAGIGVGKDIVVVGGGYSGDFGVGNLPSAIADVDPFVVGFDALSPNQLTPKWTWPPTGSGFERSRYEAVYDLAVVAPTECDGGVVYVAGCIVDPGAGFQNCYHAYGDAQKGGFLVKLNLLTGEEIGDPIVMTPGPSQVLSPSAIAADTTGLWVAFSLRGSGTVPGLPMQTAIDLDALVVRFSP